jgi:hypothetical protein
MTTRFRYLNGIDWVITGLDHSIRQTAGFGNWSQVVLELDGEPDFDRINNAVQRYANSFPVLQGRAARGWQLVPLWKIPRRTRPMRVPVSKFVLPAEAPFKSVAELLGRNVSAKPGTPGCYIGFNLVYMTHKTYLAFCFDHRLFDARGAEMFLQGLICCLNTDNLPSDTNVPPQKSCLSPWTEKFQSGKQVVRMLHDQRREVAPFGLEPDEKKDFSFRFSVLSFDKERSDELLNRAYEKAGYLMLAPWLADRMTTALDQAAPVAARNMEGYMVPCSADLRPESDPHMFFNHVAFICLSCKAGQQSRAQQFSRQFVDQVKKQMPRHFENAWKLARIVPAPLFGRLLRKELNQFAGTFSMASVGDGLSALEPVDGCAVQNVFHMPMVPPSPGLGFFANMFQGKLNLCLTSTSWTLSDEEHAKLLSCLKDVLT